MLNFTIPLLSFSFNLVDILFFIVLFYFILASSGFIDTALEIAGMILSLLISYITYSFLGSYLSSFLFIPRGISFAISFFIIWFFAELALHFLILLAVLPLLHKIRTHRWNRYLGYFPGILQATVIFSFFVSLVFALPVKGSIKKAILESESGPFFVNLAQSLEKHVKNVFSEAISESLNFLTVKPESSESLPLGFSLSTKDMKNDEESERTMLQLINSERSKRGLESLNPDGNLQRLARSYAVEMFSLGFFSHTGADGSTPGERAQRMQVEYLILGENLAFAPDVYLAHQGLMNSEGHRKNILSEEYLQVGIGIIDGGVYGKMFVQEFSN